MSSFFERRLKREKDKAKKAEEKLNEQRKKEVDAISSDELQSMLEQVFTAEPEEKTPSIDVIEKIVEDASNAEIASINSATHQAHNVYYNNEHKKFMLVTIEYNIVTGSSKIIGEKPFSDDVAVATSKISDLFALKLFRREENI